MTGEGREEAVREELAVARDELAAARTLLDGGFARVALTRLYFAAFHGVRALLYGDDLEPRSHRGVQHLFNLHFVRTGRATAEEGRLLVRLQKFREEADYGVAFPADEEVAHREMEAVEEMVVRVAAEVAKRD